MMEWYFQFGFAPFSGILRGGHLSVVFYGCGDLSMVLDQFSLFLMLQGSCDPVLPHSPKKFEISVLGIFFALS